MGGWPPGSNPAHRCSGEYKAVVPKPINEYISPCVQFLAAQRFARYHIERDVAAFPRLVVFTSVGKARVSAAHVLGARFHKPIGRGD